MRQPKRKVSKAQLHYGLRPGEQLGKNTIGCYPTVLDEFKTLVLIQEQFRSIARFGDGEISIATGGTCISQREVPSEMRVEMRRVLANPGDCLVGIPNIFSESPKRGKWMKFASEKIVRYMPEPVYASSFITRPDSAPWIDTPGYWNRVRSLWQNRGVHLVYGGPDSKSLKPDWLLAQGAQVVIEHVGKRTNAYCGIDKLEKQIVAQADENQPILLCLGPTATILAWRLANRGLWAIDLGHIGMFIK